MKYFGKILLVLVGFLNLASFNYAHADSVTNLTIGLLPASANYGNTFSSASSTPFYDAYYFTIPTASTPEASTSSVTSTISLGSFLGINNLQARLYAGHSNTTGSVGGSIISPWGTMVNPVPGVTIETVVLNPTLPLVAGIYTLQIRGAVTGSGGGSYAGVLNLTPVPEPETYAMLLAGLGLVGFISRRRQFS